MIIRKQTQNEIIGKKRKIMNKIRLLIIGYWKSLVFLFNILFGILMKTFKNSFLRNGDCTKIAKFFHDNEETNVMLMPSVRQLSKIVSNTDSLGFSSAIFSNFTDSEVKKSKYVCSATPISWVSSAIIGDSPDF
uniref:Uncharacterized protein n=1 Tax=Romanomermis culicivorax TaxID=13658 RepID=A0A915ISS6_ROMCU